MTTWNIGLHTFMVENTQRFTRIILPCNTYSVSASLADGSGVTSLSYRNTLIQSSTILGLPMLWRMR
jgi:hypothetical protein